MTIEQTIVEVIESRDLIEVAQETVEVVVSGGAARVVDLEGSVEVVDLSDPEVIETGVPGPRGGSVAAYRHSQGVASAVWVIDHGMGFYPNVTVLDSTGREVVGFVQYPSADRVVLTFAAPFGGEAYLS